jgi:hypothetical protein
VADCTGGAGQTYRAEARAVVGYPSADNLYQAPLERLAAPRGTFRDLTAPAPQHRWGMHMISPLPKTLNAANNVDAGMHGLEQRGTPNAVGQRTLERTYGKSRR